METITPEMIKKATEAYAEALTAHMIAKKKYEHSNAVLKKTHNNVVLAFEELRALRMQS